MSETITPSWTLGDRVRKARRIAGFANQEDLARAAGISRGTVSNAEDGERLPHPNNLKAIAEACNVDLDWLRGDAYIHRITDGGPGHSTHPDAEQMTFPLDLPAAA